MHDYISYSESLQVNSLYPDFHARNSRSVPVNRAIWRNISSDPVLIETVLPRERGRNHILTYQKGPFPEQTSEPAHSDRRTWSSSHGPA